MNVVNEPWFVAAGAVRRLDDTEKAKLNLGLKGGDTNIVNEPGLYGLVMASRKPEAKAFKRWITHEVLPTIRKAGAYSTRDSYTIDDPIERAKRWIEEEQERRRFESKVTVLTKSNEEMQPESDGSERIFITPKGRELFRRILAERDGNA